MFLYVVQTTEFVPLCQSLFNTFSPNKYLHSSSQCSLNSGCQGTMHRLLLQSKAIVKGGAKAGLWFFHLFGGVTDCWQQCILPTQC